MIEPARSYLYVPAHRSEHVAKAFASEADAVVLDLEDAVSVSEKDLARECAAMVLRERPSKPTWVRVNGLDSDLTERDVRTVASPHLAGIRLPKCESAAEVRKVADWLRRHGVRAAIQCLIESARGLERISQDPRRRLGCGRDGAWRDGPMHRSQSRSDGA